MSQTSLVDRLLSERIVLWNGMLYTRWRAIQIIDEQYKHETIERREWLKGCFVWWNRPALTDAEIEQMYTEGRLVNTVPNVFPDAWVAACKDADPGWIV